MPEYRFFVTAVVLQRETGGSLAETLDNLSEVIRTRKAITLKAKALSAEARMSVYVLAALPFFAVGALSVMSPDYIGETVRAGRQDAARHRRHPDDPGPRLHAVDDPEYLPMMSALDPVQIAVIAGAIFVVSAAGFILLEMERRRRLLTRAISGKDGEAGGGQRLQPEGILHRLGACGVPHDHGRSEGDRADRENPDRRRISQQGRSLPAARTADRRAASRDGGTGGVVATCFIRWRLWSCCPPASAGPCSAGVSP